jgi:hypothetical protein
MDDNTLVKITAILALTVLEIVNLVMFKVDGAILVTIASIIAGLAGYAVGYQSGLKKKEKKEGV